MKIIHPEDPKINEYIRQEKKVKKELEGISISTDVQNTTKQQNYKTTPCIKL